MKFFTTLPKSLDSDSVIAVTGLLSDITSKPDSHKGGYARILMCQLRNAGYKNVFLLADNSRHDQLSGVDAIVFDLGAEYNGSLNLFGGVSDDVLERLRQIEMFKGRFFSWHHKLPTLQESLRGRERVASTSPKARKALRASAHGGQIGLLQTIDEKLGKCVVFDHVKPLDKLLLGDSHVDAVWTPRYMVERHDGLTLHRLLENGLQSYVERYKGVTELMVCASSIDIRHHLCRLKDPVAATIELVDRLAEQCTKLDVNCTLVETMGIENESRKLPKTGYYKGTPYAGSWSERNHLRDVFNSRLIEVCGWTQGGYNLLRYPEYFFNSARELDFAVMEKPQSIHISPVHFRWNLEKNENRWRY